jgi:hypothetical protein
MEFGIVKNIPIHIDKQVVDTFHVGIEIDRIDRGDLIGS